jgi:hypothetical protein
MKNSSNLTSFKPTSKRSLSCSESFLSDLVSQKRMAEIREFQKESRLGTVEPLTQPDFVKEVTETGASTWVFVHLFKD